MEVGWHLARMRQREKELPQMQKPTMVYLKNMGERYVDTPI